MKTNEIQKLTVTVESRRGSKTLKTRSVYDHRTNAYWSDDLIEERGIKSFSDLADLKETLNWNVAGDASKYAFRWIITGKTSVGESLVFA